MGISDIPILSMLRTKLDWSQERQRVLAENVANSDTPNFKPRDLAPPKFDVAPAEGSPGNVSQVRLATTDGGHISVGSLSGATTSRTTRPHYDIRPTGNAVSIEEEMMKVSANQMDYQAATALYTRSLNLLKTAMGRGK